MDERVLKVMAKVPRHEFVPVEVQHYAYLNTPIPIGFDKTISQPMMVAVTTYLLELKPDDIITASMPPRDTADQIRKLRPAE